MKAALLLIGVSLISLLAMSCSVKLTREPGNPVQKKIVHEITDNLEPYRLNIHSICYESRRNLVSGTSLIVCSTPRMPFVDRKAAEQFVSKVLKVIVDTIQAPANRLYLDEFPINMKKTSIVIYFTDPLTGTAPQPPYYFKIGWNGFKFFTKYVQKNEQYEFYTEFDEFPEPSPWFKKIYGETNGFADRYANQHQLNHYHTGRCTPGIREISECSFALSSDQQVQLQEAKKLAHDCVSQYVSFISAQPSTKEYFSGIFRHCIEADSFQLQYVGIRIGFWTKEMNRVMPPYIAEIRFFNNKYHYYQADPETQSLVLVYEEPFDQSETEDVQNN